MSTDDLRNQKGLALLEFQEAEARVRDVKYALDQLAKRFQEFGAQLNRNAAVVLETPEEAHGDISMQAAYRLARELQAASVLLDEAAAKKTVFGL
jgi:arginyl-tRNA synthetase